MSTDHERVIRPSAHCGRARFGSTLTADGNYLLVGASARDSSEGVASACLYDTSSWTLAGALTNARTGEYAGFADATALSSRLGIAAVNAPGYELGDDPVHVFERSKGWQRTRLLPNPDDPSHAGESYWADALAFAGDNLAVGSTLAAPGIGSTPVVFVFANASGKPTVLRPSRGGPSDFGAALAATGDRLVVGAPTDDGSGRVYVYRHTGSSFDEITQLVSPIRTLRAEFGRTVAVSGEWIAVGSPRLDGAIRGVGQVDLFERRGGSYVHVQTLASPHPEQDSWFGRSLALDGRRLAIGQPGGPGRRGRVFRYEITAGAVLPLGEWRPRDLADNEWFGDSVAFGPGWLAAGAPSSTEPSRFGRVVVRDWP